MPDTAETAPGGQLELDFPLLGGRPRARAEVVSWRRDGADVALLRLDTVVEGARPVPLVDGTGVWGHPFRVLGYPAGADHGVWASGTLRAGQGSGWLQIEAQAPGPRIAEGFSGAPVWDGTQDGVVGMMVAAHRGEPTAYLVPSADLADERTLRPRCPFKGLAAFMEDDAEFFHGRDSEITRVGAAVLRRPVTLMAGPSGCGKSSLVRAGVLPRLRAEGMGVSELRPVPGARAVTVLARALTAVLEPGISEVERLTKAEELAGLMETGDDVPAELCGRILARGEGVGHVLFVDQLEEYAGADPAAARDLLTLLAALAGNDGAAMLRVVATVRPDSLGVLVTPGTSDLVSEAVEFLAPLAAEDLQRAVTAPVDAVPGLWFEPGLPERIVADAGDEPGRMPLVQFALTELWRRRTRSMLTHAAYDDLGGVAGALVGYADDALAVLTKAQQDCARRLFVQLARPGDGDASFARRPTRAADLAPTTPADHHQTVGGLRHLVHQMRGEHHRAALGGQSAQQLPYPPDAFGVQPVDRLVQHHHRGVAQKCGGDTQPLPHPQRERPDPLVRHGVQTGQVDDLLHPPTRHAMGVGQRHQMVERAAARMHRLRLQQHPQLLQGRPVLGVESAVDQGRAAGRRVQAHDHSHGGGLARPVGSQESGDLSRWGGETQVVHRRPVPVPLGQPANFDHSATPRFRPGISPDHCFEARSGHTTTRGPAGHNRHWSLVPRYQ